MPRRSRPSCTCRRSHSRPRPRLLPSCQRPANFKSSALQQIGEISRSHRLLSGRTVTFEGERTSIVEVEPGARLARRQVFEMRVDADYPDRANPTMEVTFRLERPTGEVAMRVRTVVALSELASEEEVSLAGFSLLRRAWNKNWSDP